DRRHPPSVPTRRSSDLKGDFGIGTLQGLDGELIVVDGEFWNVDFDGDAHLAPPDAKVPFAVLVDLDEADRHHVTEAMDRTAFERSEEHTSELQSRENLV